MREPTDPSPLEHSQVSPDDVPVIGASIASRYIVEEVIAAGGMSIVVRARDGRLGHAVALKVMRASRGLDDAQVSRFLREAQTVARLRSEHVVRILDVDATSSPPYLVLELVEGGDVARFVREQGPCSVERALAIVIQACRGVAEAHAIGVVHRDLKPSNLLLAKTTEGEICVKVSDFGVAKGILPGGATDLTSSGQLVGTPRYMSPEQVRGARDLDARSDVWALGVILYELLTGAGPFDAPTVADTLARIVATPAPPLRLGAPRAPARLEAIVARCLEKEATLRPSSVEALLEELAAIEASERAVRPGDPTEAGLTDATLDGQDAPALPWSPVGRETIAGNEHVAKGAKNERASDTSRRRPPSNGRWARGPIALLAVVACVGLALSARRWLRSTGARQATPGTPTSGAPGTTLLDLPLPSSSSPQALASFADGMQAVRDGAWGRARDAFARAVAADPALAAAHLRLAMTSSGSIGTVTQTRIELQRAEELRARLTEREQVFLDALEPMLQRTPSDHAEAEARLRKATERYPNDAELHLWLGYAIFGLTGIGDAAAALPSFERATALDPGLADAWESRGRSLAWLGEVAEARAALERCLAMPAAVDCLFWLKFLDAADGDCAACERDARRRIDRDPLGIVGPRNLADAFLALGRPTEAARAALVQSWKLWNDRDRAREQLADEADFDIVEGDFANARELAERELALVESDPEGDRHLRATKVLTRIALETGDRRAAGALAGGFVKRAAAWATAEGTFDKGADELPWLLRVARREGALSREDYEAARAAWVEGLRTAYASSGYGWVLAYAQAVDSPAEAKDALAKLDELGPLPPFFLTADDIELTVGKVYALAGRLDDAKTHLSRAARHCARLGDPFAHPHAELELGLVDERASDLGGACEAYRAILQQWGDAKPRSVTAERARDRARALACAK